jgi:hypothetical protein
MAIEPHSPFSNLANRPIRFILGLAMSIFPLTQCPKLVIASNQDPLQALVEALPSLFRLA